MAERDASPSTAVSLGLLVLRVAMGGMMLVPHGLPKLLDFRATAEGFPEPLGIGAPVGLALVVIAEVPCALLVVLGLFTRLAAVPLLATVAVGAFVHHAGDPFSQREIALVHLVTYAAILLAGPGRFSLDTALARSRERRLTPG